MFLLSQRKCCNDWVWGLFFGGGWAGEQGGSEFSLLVASGITKVICWKGGQLHLFSVCIKE